MESKRFLLDFEVEAHACLVHGLEKLQTIHPKLNYQITISNLQVTPGTDRPLLSFHLVVGADDIDEAIKLGPKYIDEYLHLLTVASNMTFKRHRFIRAVDWTPGLTERVCIQFHEAPDEVVPHHFLTEDLFKSIEVLQSLDMPSGIKRALKWFSNGVSSRFSDDQFQFFWFVVELIAEIGKDPTKVHDICQKCGENLYCEKCAEYPTHRAFPKQAIRTLFEKRIPKNAAKFYETALYVRNRLLHGDEVNDIERKEGIILSDVVDQLGELAWVSVVNAFLQFSSGNSVLAGVPLHIFRTNMYSHRNLNVGVKMLVYTNPNNPTLEQIARPEISFSYDDKAQDFGVVPAPPSPAKSS